MPELRVVTVLASEAACDRVADPPGACRVAPTEVMLVGDASVEVLERAVYADDPDALVAEVTDGWGLVTLEGPRAREAFARLSELELPAAGFAQGEVARLGVRVLVTPERIGLLVPSMLEAHLRERVRVDCAGVLS